MNLPDFGVLPDSMDTVVLQNIVTHGGRFPGTSAGRRCLCSLTDHLLPPTCSIAQLGRENVAATRRLAAELKVPSLMSMMLTTGSRSIYCRTFDQLQQPLLRPLK